MRVSMKARSSSSRRSRRHARDAPHTNLIRVAAVPQQDCGSNDCALAALLYLRHYIEGTLPTDGNGLAWWSGEELTAVRGRVQPIYIYISGVDTSTSEVYKNCVVGRQRV